MSAAFVKLSVEQAKQAGSAVMADPRCNNDVKAAIRRGLLKTSAGFDYYPEGNTWFDKVMVDAAKA